MWYSMSDSKDAQIEALRLEVEDLKREVADLREFVKGLYAMLNEGEEYEVSPGFLGGAEYGRINT